MLPSAMPLRQVGGTAVGVHAHGVSDTERQLYAIPTTPLHLYTVTRLSYNVLGTVRACDGVLHSSFLVTDT